MQQKIKVNCHNSILFKKEKPRYLPHFCFDKSVKKREANAKISKYQMPNDQMPNYTVQTQYVSIRPTSQKCKQRDKNRVEQRRDEKKREEKRREEYKIEDIERRKNRLCERESLHFTDVLSEKYV